MSFTNLLIHICNIQSKSLSLSGFENVPSWNTIASNVACRHDSDTSAKISDSNIRVNSDDDIFFFNPSVTIARGNRIVLDGENYDVIKINKCYNSSELHHLEVKARLSDND